MTANNYTAPEPVWPTESRNITQGYTKYHQALDISNGKKDEVRPILPGYVEYAGWMEGYGYTVIVSHIYYEKAIFSQYSHLSNVYVKQGDLVEQSAIIAKIGNTGTVRGQTGIHLHLEIEINGKNVNPLDIIKL